MVKSITASDYETEVMQSEVPVLVDFYATWCGPCKVIAPSLDELAVEFEGRAKFVKLDVDTCGDLAKKNRVRSVPTLLFYKNGQVVNTQVWPSTKQDIADKMSALI